jgi:hypothetical protein
MTIASYVDKESPLAKPVGAGYPFGPVSLKAFCTTCQRTVYIDDGDTPVCPVCSNPLIETTTDAVDDKKGAEKA